LKGKKGGKKRKAQKEGLMSIADPRGHRTGKKGSKPDSGYLAFTKGWGGERNNRSVWAKGRKTDLRRILKKIEKGLTHVWMGAKRGEEGE